MESAKLKMQKNIFPLLGINKHGNQFFSLFTSKRVKHFITGVDSCYSHKTQAVKSEDFVS